MFDPERIRRIAEAADPEVIETLNRAVLNASKLISQSIDTSGIASAIVENNASALAGLKVMLRAPAKSYLMRSAPGAFSNPCGVADLSGRGCVSV